MWDLTHPLPLPLPAWWVATSTGATGWVAEREGVTGVLSTDLGEGEVRFYLTLSNGGLSGLSAVISASDRT